MISSLDPNNLSWNMLKVAISNWTAVTLHGLNLAGMLTKYSLSVVAQESY